MKRIRTLYTWLGIDEDAGSTEIKKAYRNEAKKHHPDRGGDSQRFAKIQEAYTVLMNPASRQRYDAKVHRVRIQLRVQEVRDSAFSRLREMWEDEEKVYKKTQENRRKSAHADYFAQQDHLEQEWAVRYAEMMGDFRQREGLNTENLQEILRTTDDILSAMEGSGKVRIPTQRVEQPPVNIDLKPEVELGERAQHVVADLRDTIVKAERLVRIFNRITGAAK
jgi:curved DNA-binding protein CbpA